MNLLLLCGSLREQSYNKAALGALAELCPAAIICESADISALPLFNPDLDENAQAEVYKLKTQLASAHGLVIASPEYAHGISGPLKNALDWLVAGSEFPEVPIMLINTSPRATHAMSALEEVLKTMSGHVIKDAYTTLPLLGSDFDIHQILQDESCTSLLLEGLAKFTRHIENTPLRLGHFDNHELT